MSSYTLTNEPLDEMYTSPNAVRLDFVARPLSEEPVVEEYEDGVFIDFGGEPYDVEYHDAGVQVWRDRSGRIVAIDIVYEDDGDVARD